MNLKIRNSGWLSTCGVAGARASAAFTLTEIMVSGALFVVVVTAILACHLAGLEFNEFVRPKVENSRYSRETLARMIEEIRCANSIDIGTGALSSFTAAGSTNAQMGNAIKIYTTTNTSQYIYYYRDSTNNTVNKIDISNSIPYVIATAVTNDAIFSMEDFGGVVYSNRQNNAVLSILLQMRRTTGYKAISDAYQIRTKVTRRNIL